MFFKVVVFIHAVLVKISVVVLVWNVWKAHP